MSASDTDVGAGPVRSDAWLVTWTVLAGTFAVGINFTILAVSRPTIATDLRADATTLVWLISGPILANALFTPTAGKVGDLLGHRRVYLWGMAGSAAFALASAVAWDAWSLVAFRVLGAIVGSAAAPSSMAMINLVFPPARRSAALGYWSLVGAGGPVVGVIIGGPLVDAFGWRSIFAIQVPLLLGATVLAWRVVPDTPRRPRSAFDVAGNVALGVSLLALLLAVERGRSWGWGSAPTLVCFAISVVAGVVFARIELAAEHPLVPIRYFRDRAFSVPIVAVFFAQFGYMGGFILAPKLLADVGNEDPGRISLLLIPRPLTFAIAGVAAGYVVRRLGSRPIAALGTGLVAVSMLMISATSRDLDLLVVIGAIAISGLGMGMVQPVISTSVANAVDDQDLGVAGAAQQMVIQVATSLGMNLLDSLQAGWVDSEGLAGSYALAYRVGAALTVVGVGVAWFLPRRVPDPVLSRAG